MNPVERGVWLPALLAVLAASCGGAQSFQPGFSEYREPEFSEVVSTLQQSADREEQPVLVGITAPPAPRIYAWDLSASRELWSVPVSDARSAPIAAGATVVTQEGDAVVVRSLATGAVVRRVEAEGAVLIGADGVDELVVISMRTGSAQTPHGRLVALRGDSRLWEREVDLPTGVPAVVGQLILVPWGTQRVTVIDAGSGRERARLRIRDDVVGQAFVDRGSIYFGQHGIFRVTPTVQTGSKRTAAYFTPRGRHLPGQPLFMRDGYEPVPAPDSALHRLRLVWRPAGTGETVGLEDDNLYLVFYRYVFALAPDADDVRWVYVHPSDVVGARAQPGGLLVADERGGLAFVTARGGQSVWSQDTHHDAMAVDVRAGSFVPSGEQAPPEPAPLLERLFEAAMLDDARLSGGRALAIEHMARSDEPSVTAHLVAICSDANAPVPVRTVACASVGERTRGEDAVLAALALRASFVDDTAAPPVGPLSRAAARMGIRRAIPDLIAHLEHPATRSEDLAPLLAALGTLRAASSARAIEKFVRLYHADASDAHVVEALGVAMETLAAIRGHGADAVLHRIADDPMSPAAVRARATQVLAALAEPARPAVAAAAPTPTAPSAAVPDTRPAQLTQAMVDAALAPAARQLQRCVDGAETPPPSARIVMVVAPDGALEGVSILPAGVAPCIDGLVRERRFPATRADRVQRVTYMVRRGATPPAVPARGAGRAGAPGAGPARATPPSGGAGRATPVTPAIAPPGRPPRAPPDGGVARPRARAAITDGGVLRPRARPAVTDGGVARPRARAAITDGGVLRPRARPAVTDGGVARPRARAAITDGGVARPRARPAPMDGGIARPRARPAVTDGGVARPRPRPARADGGVAAPRPRRAPVDG